MAKSSKFLNAHHSTCQDHPKHLAKEIALFPWIASNAHLEYLILATVVIFAASCFCHNSLPVVCPWPEQTPVTIQTVAPIQVTGKSLKVYSWNWWWNYHDWITNSIWAFFETVCFWYKVSNLHFWVPQLFSRSYQIWAPHRPPVCSIATSMRSFQISPDFILGNDGKAVERQNRCQETTPKILLYSRITQLWQWWFTSLPSTSPP